MRYQIFFILTLLAFSAVLHGQQDCASSAGTLSGAAGVIHFTVGQTVCLSGSTELGAWNQGVQQPYCTSSTDTVGVAVCQGESYASALITIPSDSTAEARTLLVPKYTTSGGCRVTTIVRLVVNPAYDFSDSVSVCDGYFWPITGEVFTESGVYSEPLQTTEGCDSTITLRLHVRQSTDTNIADQSVGSYMWYGMPLESSGEYEYVLTNQVRCDSIIHLSLAVLQDYDAPTLLQYNGIVIMVDHFPDSINGQRLDWAGYRWVHDGEVIEDWNGDTYYDYGNARYHLLSGCYCIEVPTDVTRRYWYRSEPICFPMAIDDVDQPSFSLYPTPATVGSLLTARLADASWQGSTLLLYDMQGSLLASQQFDDDRLQFASPRTAGIYVAVVALRDGTRIPRRFVVR